MVTIFKVLTKQGENAPGGASDYVINRNMVAGFGMMTFPDAYGTSGVISFLVGRNGAIYERDLAEDTKRSQARSTYSTRPRTGDLCARIRSTGIRGDVMRSSAAISGFTASCGSKA
jgi:hypothetical protein